MNILNVPNPLHSRVCRLGVNKDIWPENVHIKSFNVRLVKLSFLVLCVETVWPVHFVDKRTLNDDDVEIWNMVMMISTFRECKLPVVQNPQAHSRTDFCIRYFAIGYY